LTGKTYVLCRPKGGLNDTLNQIEICRAYAAGHGRILLVDGRYSGLLGEFGDYFQMEGNDHIFTMTDKSVPDVDLLDCLPAEVQGRVSLVRAKAFNTSGVLSTTDAETGVLLSFPMDIDHPQTLLLHQQGGGGTQSFDLIDRLTLAPWLAQEVRSRIDQLPAGYSALHIRNTDYRTDVEMVLAAIRSQVVGQDLLVCSDDPEVLLAIRLGLPDTRIHQITTLVLDGGVAQHLHGLRAENSQRHQIATVSIIDLCAMAAATTLYVPVLHSKKNGIKADFTGMNKLSGFSILAAHLCADKQRLRRLLGKAGIGFLPDLQNGMVKLLGEQRPAARIQQPTGIGRLLDHFRRLLRRATPDM